LLPNSPGAQDTAYLRFIDDKHGQETMRLGTKAYSHVSYMT
jgi:hypothetical protein